MNILQKIFKKKVNYERENYREIKRNLAERQKEVYKAVALLNYPCNVRQVSNYLGWDSGSVSPRLSELVKKGQIKVIDHKRGFDRRWRKYYVAVHF